MGQLESPRTDKGSAQDGQGISVFLPFPCFQLKPGVGANPVQFHLLLKLVIETQKMPLVIDVLQDGVISEPFPYAVAFGYLSNVHFLSSIIIET